MQTPIPPLPTLPFHLMLSLSGWISSNTAFASLKSALPPEMARHLSLLQSEAQELARHELSQLQKGIELYQDTPFERILTDPPAVWRQGAARLLDYGDVGCRMSDVGSKSPSTSDIRHPTSILLIPSLINRHYILDLAPGRSFARFLAERGHEVLLLDWGVPGAQEHDYDCADYVEKVLLPAIRFVSETQGGRIVLAGYCMGGVLALAAAQLAAIHVSGLALLAAPWDYAAPDVNMPRLGPELLSQMETWLAEMDEMPPETLQVLFYWQNPFLFNHKFQRLARLKPGSAAFKEFLALEHWVNDGVPITRGVARDCLIDWPQRNALMERKWRVCGKPIDPRRINIPAFIAAPQHDFIVPPGCALGLAKQLPGAALCHPNSGHVGMIVGSRAKHELWQDFAAWVET